MTVIMHATPANDEVHGLAEGPVWDPIRERVLWVDIHRGLVFSGRLTDDDRIEIEERVEVDETVGAVAVAEDGRWLIAGAQQTFVRDADGVRPETRLLDNPSRRLNDGQVDPDGRFVVGTLAFAEDTTTETLVRIEDDGSLTTLDDDLTLSNGMAWVDGDMYSIDTLSRLVYRRRYPVGDRDIHLRFEDGPYPDGMCRDAEGSLWIAFWDGGAVGRYLPDGTCGTIVRTGVPHTTSAAFAGPDLDVLVITTDTTIMTARTGHRGVAPTWWNGRP